MKTGENTIKFKFSDNKSDKCVLLKDQRDGREAGVKEMKSVKRPALQSVSTISSSLFVSSSPSSPLLPASASSLSNSISLES